MNSLSKMLRNRQHLEKVCDVTLVREDNERIRAHKVAVASVITTSGTIFQNDDKNTYYEIIHIEGFLFKIHYILGCAGVQCRIYGE